MTESSKPTELADQVTVNLSFRDIYKHIPPKSLTPKLNIPDYMPEEVESIRETGITEEAFQSSSYIRRLDEQYDRRINSPHFKILQKRVENALSLSYTTPMFQTHIMEAFRSLYILGRADHNAEMNRNDWTLILAFDFIPTVEQPSPGIFNQERARVIERQMLQREKETFELEYQIVSEGDNLELREEKRLFLEQWERAIADGHSNE